MSAQRHQTPEGAGIPVLLYHSVADAPPPGQRMPFTVTPARFAEHVAMMAGSGRTAMTISQLAEALTGRRALPERPLGVTFDDGFDDTVAAVALLRESGISSTVYVTTGNIGTPRGISLAGLRALTDDGRRGRGAHRFPPHLDEPRCERPPGRSPTRATSSRSISAPAWRASPIPTATTAAVSARRSSRPASHRPRR